MTASPDYTRLTARRALAALVTLEDRPTVELTPTERDAFGTVKRVCADVAEGVR